MTDKDRRSAWRFIAAQQPWQECEKDLLLFCSSDNDPQVRCGRMDVYLYIRDSVIGEAIKEDGT